MEEKNISAKTKNTFLVRVKEKTASAGKKWNAIRKSGFTKQKVIVAASVLMLGAAVYLNYAFFGAGLPTDSGVDDATIGQSAYVSSDVTQSEDYFSMVELTRQKARDESMEVLKLVVDNEASIQSAKEEAMQKIQQTADEMQDEANIEALVVSKGFENCIAVLSEGKANIVVKSEGLLPNEIAQIKEIVYDQAGIVPANVKIIEKN